MANYYDILGVEKNATQAEIKSAFRKKARELHPDVNKAPDAEAKFKELGKAYETLSNEEKRSLYDRYGEEGLSNAGYDSSGPFDFGFGNINDIFESFFGMGGFSSGRTVDPNAPQQGHDLRLDIELEFEEAAFGVEKEIKIDHLEMCKDCYGTGAEPGSKPTVCPECNGQGRVVRLTKTILGSIQQVTTCPKCGGAGQVISNPCKKCKGEGRIETEKTIKVKIPSGVDNHAKIRIAHEGDAGKNGGASGDLYIILYVKPHKNFKREGFNVYSEIEITVPQAVLGDTINVNTIHGNKELNVPSGIEYGKILTIKNAGIPYLGHSDKKGDHYVVVKYKTPKNINEEEKRLYKKLYELSEKKKHNEKFIDKFKNAIHN
jgi:molecular chaperone DnaJ